MTRYDPDELENDWEFKIIRSVTPVFRKSEVLQRVLQEEAVAGWKLLEKLDDNRIRLKRPASAQRKDAMLPPGVDPYRTQIGSGASAVAALMVGLALILFFGVLVMLLGLREESFSAPEGAIVFSIVIFLGIMVSMIAVVRSRM